MSSGPTIAVVTRRVFVAAGGGGDVIAATMLAVRELTDDSVVVATFSWDRLIVDPLPGPRSVDDFVDLISPVAGVHQVTSSTTCRPPAGSTLPRLAGSLPAQLFLLDASTGAVGLGRQMPTSPIMSRPMSSSSSTLVGMTLVGISSRGEASRGFAAR